MVCGSFAAAKTGLTGPYRGGRREGMVDGIRVVEFHLPYANKHSLPRRALTFLKFALRSARMALKGDVDLIFATSTPLTAGIPPILARRLGRKTPIVFEVRDLWPELPQAMGVIRDRRILKALEILERESYRAADACIGLSPGMVEGIRRVAGPNKPVVMIPNGCDLDLFHPSRRAALEIPGVPPGAFTALFSGAHGQANGLEAILDAAAVLKLGGVDDVHLLFVGEGKLKPALKERAEREGLTNCHFLDPMPKVELARLVASVDVGLMVLAPVPAFAYGTSPNKFFDYIAAGLPVLVNYPGWMADLVTEHQCGVAVPARDAEAFADGLLRLRETDRQEMSLRARALAEAEFDRADLAAQFVDLLERVGTAPSLPRKEIGSV